MRAFERRLKEKEHKPEHAQDDLEREKMLAEYFSAKKAMQNL